MTSIYIIGSLRNPQVPKVAKALRLYGFEVFDDWYAATSRRRNCCDVQQEMTWNPMSGRTIRTMPK